jgi:DnaJ-class molecular chaperone
MHEHRLHFTSPPPAQYNPKQWLGDEDFCTQVGRSMFQSLTILGLGLGASETEIKVHYRQLAWKYHPDKNNPATTGLNAAETSTFFQLLNNAHEYLKHRA